MHRYQAQVSEYKTEVARIHRELNELKSKFFAHKRKEHAHQVAVRAQRTKQLGTIAAEARMAVPRFAGGGFSLQRSSGGPAEASERR